MGRLDEGVVFLPFRLLRWLVFLLWGEARIIVVAPVLINAQMAQKIGQREGRQALRIIAPLFQTEHDIEGKDIFHPNDRWGNLTADARHGQHKEALILQPRDQARVDQRTLAGTGLRIKEYQPLGQHACKEFACLTFAPKKAFPFSGGKGAGTDVWVSGRWLGRRGWCAHGLS